MKRKESKKNFFKFHDINTFFDGMELSLCLAFVPYISVYFFKEFDYKVSIIITLSLVFLSNIIRTFTPIIFKKIIPLNFNILLTILIAIGYLLPLVIPNDILLVSVFVLFLSRSAVGIVGSLNSSFFLRENLDIVFKSSSNIKFWFIYVVGLFVGYLIAEFLNQIFSNNQLSEGFWKIAFLILFLLYSLIILFGKKFTEINLSRIEFIGNLNYKFQMKLFKTLFENLFLVVPLFFLFFFSVNSWLPSTILPENKQILEIELTSVIFLIIIMICSNFIFDLINKTKSFYLITTSGILLFLILATFSDFYTSYSINLFHFILASYSGFSLSIFLYKVQKKKSDSEYSFFIITNLFFILISIAMLFFVYQLMYISVVYKNVYFILFIIFSISLISTISKIKND